MRYKQKSREGVFEMKYIELSEDGGSLNGYFCHAAENYYMSKMSEPFYMLWTTTPSLMMGKYQNVYAEIDTEYASKVGLTICRRFSGGGTCLTDEGCVQFTYFFPNVKGCDVNFRDCCADVVNALKKLGADAEFNDRNDIYLDGRKICGNARYSNDHGLIHHGTILWRGDLDVLEKALTPDPEKIRAKGIKSVRARVLNVAEHIGSDMSAVQFRKYLADELGGEVYHIPDDERAEIMKIADAISTDEYIYGKNPVFDYTYKQRFAGGSVTLNVSVKESIIAQCNIVGDFFYDGDISALTQAMVGVKFGSEEMKKVLSDYNKFYLIEIEDLFSLIRI